MREWRCSTCYTLLGKLVENGEIEVQYQGVKYRIKGTVRTTCRRCSTPSSITSTTT